MSDRLLNEQNAGPLEIGEVFLEKYDVVALIGRGGYGWVYHGIDRWLGRHVAIKVIHGPGGMTRDVFRRAQAEAQFLARFKHPNVVEVLDGGMTKKNDIYIVMELLQGRTLQEAIRQVGKLEVEEATSIFAQIADGIQAAHEAKVIHRDLKPANVIILKGNKVKVLDFGIAKMEDAAWETARDIVLGTVYYMSPEQVQGLNITAQSDIYSLGVMLDEALSGELYVRRIARRRGEALNNIYSVMPIIVNLDTDDPPLHQREVHVPSHLGRIADRCMAKVPRQRFAQMRELAAALRASGERYFSDMQQSGGVSHCRDLSRGAESSLAPDALAGHPRALAAAAVAASDTDPLRGPRFLGEAGLTPPPAAEPLEVRFSTVTVTAAPFAHVGSAAMLPSAVNGDHNPRASQSPDVSSGAAGAAPAPHQAVAAAGSRQTLRMYSGGEAGQSHARPAALAHAERERIQPALPTPARVSTAPRAAGPRAAPVAAPVATPSTHKRGLTPSTVSPVSSQLRGSGQSVPPTITRRASFTRRGVGVIVAAFLGALLFGGGTLAYLRSSKTPSAAADSSAAVIEPVNATRAASAVMPLAHSAAPDREHASPPPSAQVAELAARVAADPPAAPTQSPAPASAPAQTARSTRTSAPSSANPPRAATAKATPQPTTKDEMEERLRMLDEDFKRQDPGKRDPWLR